MLPKKKRISRSEFAEVYTSLKNLRGSFFYIKTNRTHPIFKVSIVISKKVCKSSVERHFLKRIMYDVFQKLDQEHSLKGFYIIFIQQKTKNTFVEIVDEVKHILSIQ